uniref:Uncharacterized protein n=1 Tax=Apoglossum ruscifolium TaxID=167976 RepID=A0A4D6WM21_9FLOR|nr:hypothetical protein [Apoglossum ruscifolium]
MKKIYIKINSVIILAYIQSPNILIPKNSLIETNQTGLFNDTVIDIIPLQELKYNLIDSINTHIDVFSNKCLLSSFLCNYHYLKGNRGLNYDDLVRAATRISQRFDDPRFFSLFYIFLHNTIDISDDIIYILNNVSHFIYLYIYYIQIYLSKYIF